MECALGDVVEQARALVAAGVDDIDPRVKIIELTQAFNRCDQAR